MRKGARRIKRGGKRSSSTDGIAHPVGNGGRLRLSDLEAGRSGVVTGVDTDNEKRLQILLAMGILPRRKIEVIQNFPSYVFQIGHTQYAVDSRIADAIEVEIEESSNSPHIMKCRV